MGRQLSLSICLYEKPRNVRFRGHTRRSSAPEPLCHRICEGTPRRDTRMPLQKEHLRYRRGWPFWMAASNVIIKNQIRADDTASWKLVLKVFFILREHFETQSEVPIQAASAGRAMQPGVRGWGRFPVCSVRVKT